MFTAHIITPTSIKEPELGDTILTPKGWQTINDIKKGEYSGIDLGIITVSKDQLMTERKSQVKASALFRKRISMYRGVTFPVLEKHLKLFLGVRVPSLELFDMERINFDMACTELNNYTIIKYLRSDTRKTYISRGLNIRFVESALIAGYSLVEHQTMVRTNCVELYDIKKRIEVNSVGYEIDVNQPFVYSNNRVFLL